MANNNSIIGIYLCSGPFFGTTVPLTECSIFLIHDSGFEQRLCGMVEVKREDDNILYKSDNTTPIGIDVGFQLTLEARFEKIESFVWLFSQTKEEKLTYYFSISEDVRYHHCRDHFLDDVSEHRGDSTLSLTQARHYPIEVHFTNQLVEYSDDV